MPDKKLIHELRKLLNQRGKVSEAQKEYTRAEERAMMQMYPQTITFESALSGKLRNLESYVGKHLLRLMLNGKAA
ncbi:MAG TPA: hypothetical protein DDX85_07300 [Nitrospiraceae bacterium]|nr:hypothetical protein [Nitrospiraceae bacterium]